MSRAGATWALGLAALALASACRPAGNGEAGTRTPLILISVDTVRADALSDDVTPELQRLAADSVAFTAAVAPMPFTLTSHMSLLTGLPPDVHGVFGRDDRLVGKVETLAEILTVAGYTAAAVVSSDWLAEGFGFGRGFSVYRELDLQLTFADRVNGAALDALDEIVGDGGSPFLFVHYYDAHSDFDRSDNRRPYYSSSESSERLDASCAEGVCSPEGACATGFLLWATRNPNEVSGETRRCLRESYLAGVSDLDRGVGGLLAELRVRGLYERALIVVTSDHGEEFGEHGQFVHAQTFRESLAVPLLVKLPEGRLAGAVNAGPAELADVLPTVLGVLELPTPSAVEGRDLLADGTGGGRVLLAQNKHRRERYSLTFEGWRLIHDYVTDRSSLYATESDPGEQRDLSAKLPERVSELRSLLDRRLRHDRLRREALGPSGDEQGEVLEEEARRRLEALGYVD